MNSAVKSRHWMKLTFAVSMLSAVIVVRMHGGFNQGVVDQELSQLRNEHASLVSTKAALSKVQSVVVDEDYGDNASWSVPVGWSVQIGSSKDPDLETWNLKTDSTPTWTDLVQTITQLAKKPGLRINAVEIRSRGTLTQREIASVGIELVYPTKTPPRLGVADGAVFPGTLSPAKPPAVVSGPSLQAARPPAAIGSAHGPDLHNPRGPRADNFVTKTSNP